jgi:hypothetical protein
VVDFKVEGRIDNGLPRNLVKKCKYHHSHGRSVKGPKLPQFLTLNQFTAGAANPLNGVAHFRDEAAGIGVYLGYDFGVVDLTLQLRHELVSKGAFDVYGKHETRVVAGLVIPIWNPTPPAPPRPVVAKY